MSFITRRPFAITTLVLALSAAWLALSGLQRHHGADSLLRSLVSIQEWTPYFWGQNRVGMVTALIAVPLRDPLTNLVFQCGVSTFAALVALLLLTSHVGSPPARVAAAAAGTILVLIGLTSREQFRLLMGHHEYGEALALGTAGLWLLESERGRTSRARFAAALVALFLAHWVNVAVALFLVPLVVARFVYRVEESAGTSPAPDVERRPAVRRRNVSLAAIAGCFLAQLAMAGTLGPSGPFALGGYVARAPWEWPSAWVDLTTNAWRDFLHPEMRAGLGLLLLTGAIAAWARRGHDVLGRAARAATPLVVAAIVYLVLIGTVDHVGRNNMNSRYAFPALLAIIAAAASFCFVALDAISSRAVSRIALVLVVVVPIVVGYRHGRPSMARVRGVFVERFGSLAAQVDAVRGTHLAGDYWTVWPHVFAIALRRHEANDDTPIWGVTGRTVGTWDQWRAAPPHEMRVVVPIDEREVGLSWWRTYSPHSLHRRETRDLAIVYEVR